MGELNGYQKRVDVCGSSIRYLEGGKGPPVLLLPSAAGRATEYLEIIPLLEKEFHLYAVDYPGFGRSDPLLMVEKQGDLASFVAAWMDAVGLAQCRLVGFSMGGWVALSIVLSRPERISRLALIGTTAGKIPAVPIISPAGLSFQEILNAFYYRPEIKRRLSQQKLTAEEKEEVYRSSRAFARLLRHMPGIPEFYSRLREITLPTLVIGSDQDRAIPLPHQERLHSGISGSKLVVFKETGHAILVERPFELAEEIRSFLREGGRKEG